MSLGHEYLVEFRFGDPEVLVEGSGAGIPGRREGFAGSPVGPLLEPASEGLGKCRFFPISEFFSQFGPAFTAVLGIPRR